jgi:hypothetical protein
MADSSVEIQGLRIKAYDLGDGTYSVATTAATPPDPPPDPPPTPDPAALDALVQAFCVYYNGVYTVEVNGGTF